MKTYGTLLILCAIATCSDAQDCSIVELGPHHRTWAVVREVTFGGQSRHSTSQIVELEGGMNRQTEAGEWVPASSRIELFEDGAVVREAQFEAW